MNEDPVVQDQMLVAYFFQHPNYDANDLSEAITAGYDPVATQSLLSIYQFKAELIRQDYNNRSVVDYWGEYVGPMVGGIINLGGMDGEQPNQTPNWQFRDARHQRIAYTRRGWTPEIIDDTLINPAGRAGTVDYATGDPATSYYRSDGHYVIRNDRTGEIIQVSNLNDPGWIDPLTNQPVRPR